MAWNDGEYGLGERSRDLREKTDTPKPVRPVMIPKKQPGAFRPLGIPCIRDRVAQTAALLVLEPIFEADLQPDPYAYRPERSANDAVTHVHRLLNTGQNEVVDGDLSNYFGEIPIHPSRRLDDALCPVPYPHPRWVQAQAAQGLAGDADGGDGGPRRHDSLGQGPQGTEGHTGSWDRVVRRSRPLRATSPCVGLSSVGRRWAMPGAFAL